MPFKDLDRQIEKLESLTIKEIFDFGLPLLESTKQKTSQEIATEILYINYLSNSLDSHLKRKFGKDKAQIVMKKAQNLKLKYSSPDLLPTRRV